MREKKLLFIFILIIAVLSINGCTKKHSSKVESNSKDVHLIIDNANKNELPKNFRMANDKINKSTSINLTGLSSMNMSGSGAISENSLKQLKEKVNSKDIIDVDLRQESHLFVNGIGVSWYGKKNHANIKLTQNQVLNDEITKLNKIKSSDKLKIDGKNKKSAIHVSTIDNIKSFENEEQLAKSLGLGYVRFAVPDHKRPQDPQVDSFVQFIKTLPNNTWLHFHCRAGVGRTTTFMAMYDMMKNAKTVSFNDIMKRQQLIGGANLLSQQDASSVSDANIRSKFLKNFYNYCSKNADDYKTKWTDWLKSNNQA